MNKMLLLGISLSTSEIIRKARKRGWYTIVTDNIRAEDSPVKQEADEYWMISTAEEDRLEEKCREQGVNAVFAGVSEFNLDRVLSLTKRLGLPCYIDEGAWKYARSKRHFKQKCIEKGIPVIKEYQIPDPGDETAWQQIVYPVVIKPVDGSGNLGLSICKNRQELETGLKKAASSTANPNLILEQYITGEETWNHYCIAEGKAHYIYTNSAFKQPGYPTYLYPLATSAGTNMDEYMEKLNQKCIELLEEIGCKEGTAWIQGIRDQAGNFYAVEMAQRLCGGTSGEVLERVMKFDTIEWMLDTAFGIKHTSDMFPMQMERPYEAAQCICMLFADHTGKIERIIGLDQLDPALFSVEIIKEPGDFIEKDRLMGRIVFAAHTAAEICEALQYLNRTFRISDAEGSDLLVRFTDFDAVIKRHRGLMKKEEA